MSISMEYLVFKTDIRSKHRLRKIGIMLNSHPSIISWSIDLEDVDRILKIRPDGSLTELDVIEFVNSKGFRCEILTD